MDNKKCTRCRNTFNISFFIHFINGTETKTCKNCRMEEIEKKKEKPPVVRDFIIKYLKDKKCIICSATECLQFDHIDRENKIRNVSCCSNINQITEELKLCQILCYWCHRIKTYDENKKLLTNVDSSYKRSTTRLKNHVINKKLEIGKCNLCDKIVDELNFMCFDFDHLNHELKIDTVSRLIRRGVSIKNINNEIEKCQLICCICHHKKTNTIDIENKKEKYINYNEPIQKNKKHIFKKKKRRVEMLLLGKQMEVFSTISEASKKMNIDSSSISAVCLGKRKTAGGYTWKYID